MRKGYFTPPVLIILAIIIFAVAIVIAINTDLVKRLKKEPPTPSPSPTTQQSSPQESLDIVPCDINADGNCNVEDLNLLNKALGTSRGQKGYIPLADLDYDGVINEVDKQTLLKLLDQNQSNETANWETYTSRTYNFQLQYPKDWLLEEDNKTENYYDAVAKIISVEGVVSIRTINGIDIYQNFPVLNVAKREIMDSGFKYTTEETKIGNLTTAITKIEDSKKTIRATIAHPNKNLFVEISYAGDKKIFDQILSTFRFLN